MNNGTFKRLRITLSVMAVGLALLFPCGCGTTAMKGTPFFSGEYANTQGVPENRVNLWPLAYYNDPALSVLWPMGEYTETSLAFRPLFSLYRDKPGGPYSEFNVLWPLSHFSLNDRDYSYLFPVFWDSDDFFVFPLYWKFRDDTNVLFPLWIYDTEPDGYDLHLLWPIFSCHSSRNGHGWRVFPLFGHRIKGNTSSTWWIAGLGGITANTYDNTASHWFFPFYAYDREDKSFYSLAYSHFGGTTAIPPLLSWQDTDPDTGAKDIYALAGLFHQRYNAPEGKGAGHLFPLYAYDSEANSFYSLAYSHFGDTTVIPPLLSWQSADPVTGAKDFYALGGLFHNRSGTPDNSDRSWLFPLYYSDSQNFVSPLWAYGTDRNGKTIRNIIPPLISWQHTNPATDTKNLYALAGLFHQRYNAPEGKSAGHLFPLYAYDNADKSFYSLAYTRFGDTTVIPPLLSWQRVDPDTGAKDLYALGGLFRQRHNNPDGKGAGHFFPLYSYDSDHDYLFTPLYIHDKHTIAIPPLLSWQRVDPRTDAKDFYTLGGLFHQRFTENWDDRKGHFFPFYVYDNSDNALYTLFYGHWLQNAANNGRYYFTPLIASKNYSRGYWYDGDLATYRDYHHDFYVFPFYSHSARNYPLDGDLLEYARTTYQEIEEQKVKHPSIVITDLTNVVWEHEEQKDKSPSLQNREKQKINHPFIDYETHTSVLYGILAGFGHSQWLGESSRAPLLKLITDNNLSPTPRSYIERSSGYIFPLWDATSEKNLIFEDDFSAVRHDGVFEESAILFFLYDSKRESSQSANHSYTRRRILWRLMHYEKLNGDRSLDIFPAITWDAKADGTRKTTFLWRFFRYEKPAEGHTKLDLLFIPVLR